MKNATGDLTLTLTTSREVFSDCEAREVKRNIELDRPQGRAFIAKRGDRPERDKSVAAQNDRAKRADPPRHACEKKGKASAGAWNASFTKCRHCGGTHWHRDCPKDARRRTTTKRKGDARRETSLWPALMRLLMINSTLRSGAFCWPERPALVLWR
eukprot:6177830-Pleurochrysis_carterae.AAC.1